MTLALASVVLVAAIGVTRVLASLLFGLGTTDPATSGVSLLLVRWRPAACRRATTVGPDDRSQVRIARQSQPTTAGAKTSDGMRKRDLNRNSS